LALGAGGKGRKPHISGNYLTPGLCIQMVRLDFCGWSLAMVDILSEYWRFRAENARTMAEHATTDEMREELRSAAPVYDYLGDLAAHFSPPAQCCLASAWKFAEIARAEVPFRTVAKNPKS
jgi:hypothetical protein